MKRLMIVGTCSIALAMGLSAQTPSPSPSPTPSAPATASVTASISRSDLADRIHEKLEKKFRGQHGIMIEGADHEKRNEDIPAMAIPIVAIVFLTVFGAPVLIVITIGIFALVVSRMRQRTIRMMVEKGQPVPAELLAPATRAVRRRSDVRRGVIWAMIGLGAMIFFGAVNDWEGGIWSLGLIPFLIGLGYLIIWKLETKKDNPPSAS